MGAVIAAYGFGLFSPAWGQAPLDPPCTLHILQKDDFGIADSTGFEEAGLVGALLSSAYRRENPQAMTELALGTIGSAAREGFLREHLDPAKIGLSNAVLRFDKFDQDSSAYFNNRKKLGPLIEDEGPCYAELYVGVGYVRTSLYRKLAFSYILRRFDRTRARPKWVHAFGSLLGTRHFPPKTDADIEAARTELREGLDTSLAAFQAEVADKLAKSR